MTTLHQSLIDLPVEHAIAKELFRDDVILDRLACERSLHEFIRHFWSSMDPSEFVDGWHIGAVCEHLEAVTRGEIKRLIINIPPRHMKSLAVSVAWPAWTWALRNEDRRYAHAGPGTNIFIRLVFSPTRYRALTHRPQRHHFAKITGAIGAIMSCSPKIKTQSGATTRQQKATGSLRRSREWQRGRAGISSPSMILSMRLRGISHNAPDCC